ncbi:MAG: hypothetical protein AAGB32_03955 [Pseudomonadota bacterium]
MSLLVTFTDYKSGEEIDIDAQKVVAVSHYTDTHTLEQIDQWQKSSDPRKEERLTELRSKFHETGSKLHLTAPINQTNRNPHKSVVTVRETKAEVNSRIEGAVIRREVELRRALKASGLHA